MTAHAEQLFGGTSVIVSRTRHPSLASKRTCFALEDVASGPNLAPRALFDHVLNWQQVKSVNAPVGAQKAALEQFLRTQDPHAMLIEQGHEAKYFWTSAKRLGIPVFVYFRGVDATGYLRPSRRQPSRINGYREMFARITGVFAVSQFLVDELAAHGLSHPNTHVLPSGVDLHHFAPAAKRLGHVLMVGRLIEKKAPTVTIGAFLKACKTFPGAHLHVVGDGPLRVTCERFVSDQGGADRVTFYGHLDHRAVAEMMAWVPIFMQHSVTSPGNDKEGAPTSIQEAMAAGMCILSTQHAGIPYLVQDGETGYLVAEHAVGDFADRLAQMLADPAACLAMGEAAHQIARRDFDKADLHARLEILLRHHNGVS